MELQSVVKLWLMWELKVQIYRTQAANVLY